MTEIAISTYSEQIRKKTFIATIETDPAYGKYHYDGHRNCSFSCSPEESKRLNGICPVCKKPLTIGVDNRVEQLANYQKKYKPANAKFFYKVLPLHEILALAIGSAIESKAVWSAYNSLIQEFGNEFEILFDASEEEFARKNVNAKIVDLIIKNREEKIKVIPGYDGEYGKAVTGEKQATLVD